MVQLVIHGISVFSCVHMRRAPSCLKFALAIFLGYALVGPCPSIAENWIRVSASFEVDAFFDSFTFSIEFFLFETTFFRVALAAVHSFNFFTVYSSLAHNWIIFFLVALVTIARIRTTNPKLANGIGNRRKQKMGDFSGLADAA